jgi:hypothetical protein
MKKYYKKTCLLLLSVLLISLASHADEPSREMVLNRTAVTTVSSMDGFVGNSYSWHKNATQYYSNPKIADSSLQGMIQKAISNNLSAKGYEFNKNSWESDLFVGYVAALESSLSSKEIAEIYGINPGLPELSSDLNKYEKGTLIIHIFDTKIGKLLWRGALQAEVQIEREPNERWERVQNVISVLMRDFPSAKSTRK